MSSPRVTIEMPRELAEWALATIKATADQQAEWRRAHLGQITEGIMAHHERTGLLAGCLEAGIERATPKAVAA